MRREAKHLILFLVELLFSCAVLFTPGLRYRMSFAPDYTECPLLQTVYTMLFGLDCIQYVLCSRLYTKCPLLQTVYRMSFAPNCIQNVLCSRLYTECPLLQTVYRMSFAPDRMSFALYCIQNVLCSI